MNKVTTVKVKANQTIFDIAVQEYGNPEGAILLLQANPELSITDNLEADRELYVWSMEAVNYLTDVLQVEPYASSIENMLLEWATLVRPTGQGGGTTTELLAGFGIRINDFIASINFDDLNLSPNITRDDIVMFIRPSESGTNRYMKIPLSEALKLSTWDNYLRTLRDVQLTDLVDSDFIKYDAEANVWRNNHVFGIGELAYPDTDPILYYDSSVQKLRWLEVGGGLKIENGMLQLNGTLPADLWKRVDTTMSPANSGDDIDLGTGGLLANDIRSKGYNADGDNGITGNVTLLSGVSFDGTDKFTFNTKVIAYKAGIIITVAAGSDVNITIPRQP